MIGFSTESHTNLPLKNRFISTSFQQLFNSVINKKKDGAKAVLSMEK